jgi:hypothetical protein
MMRKAQITMESLLLYGAAILVVLLAIAALTYFGVFDLGNLLPSKCDMSDTGMFKCEEYAIDKGDNKVTIVVKNVASKPINFDETGFLFEASGYVDSCDTGNTATVEPVLPGASATLEITCDNIIAPAGSRVKGIITIVSKYDGGAIDTTTKGTLSAKVAE